MHARVIPLVPVDDLTPPAGIDGGAGLVGAILQEVARELQGLARDPAHLQIIDLQSLPLEANTVAALRAALGQGEVVIRIRSAALTLIEETAYPGVWWQSQGADDAALDEGPAQGRLDQIVVATVPPLVGAPREDVGEAASRLTAAAVAPLPPNEPHSTGDAHA